MLNTPADQASLRPHGPSARFAPMTDGRGGWDNSGRALAGLLDVLQRRRGAILLCVLLFPALAAVALSRITPRYTAHAAVLHEPSEYAVRELQSILRADPATDTVMASQVEIIRGMAIAERLVDRLGLERLPDFNAQLRPPSPLRRLVSRFRGPGPPQTPEMQPAT